MDLRQVSLSSPSGETRAFNHGAATATSFWWTEQLPKLRHNDAVTNIYIMKVGATTLDGCSSDLKS
jgi:hypothetical protein